MHIFNVSITTVQGLKSVRLKVWEELITQSRYPIEDARLPTRHSPFYKPDALSATRPKIQNSLTFKTSKSIYISFFENTKQENVLPKEKIGLTFNTLKGEYYLILTVNYTLKRQFCKLKPKIKILKFVCFLLQDRPIPFTSGQIFF